MGIDARAISSDLPKHWFPGKSLSANRKALEKAALLWAEARHLGPLFQLRPISETAVEIEIIPVADPIRIDFESNRLVVSFRSSNGGPGYHAAAIELLDQLGHALSVTWQWVVSSGAALDETGYATARDFTVLQAEMAAFLRQLCESAAISEDHVVNSAGELSFCLTLGLGHSPGKVGCPLGFSPLSWVSDVLAMDGDEIVEAAADFFVWWQKGMTPKTWALLLRAQLWQNAEWRPARSEAELLVRDQIRHSYAQATTAGARLPDDLELAYHQYLGCQSNSDAPAADGIGYRKYLVRRQVYESWAVSLPGYLMANEKSDSAAFEHPDLWLGVSSLNVVLKSDVSDQFSWGESFNGPLMRISQHLVCRKGQQVQEDGTFVQHAMVCSTRPKCHKLLILTLTSEKEWPFEEFDRWLMTVSCPDLANTNGPLPATLH